MSKLWVFGDSYAYESRINANSWIRLLAKSLDCSGVENKAKVGCDNLYIAHQFINNISNIAADDYIILSLTDPGRFWLFDKHPQMSNWYSIDSFWTKAKKFASKQEIEAAQGFTRYLYTSAHGDTIHEMIRHVAISSHSNCRVMQGFFPVPGVKGCLVDISRNEHKGVTMEEKFRNSKEGDSRENHLSEVNHKILADKLYKWFTEKNYLLDLTKDFEENCL
jgi:hypothetical protein